MRILLFEAVTGGGLLPADHISIPVPQPSGTLLQEGLEMVASLSSDLFQAFSPKSHITTTPLKEFRALKKTFLPENDSTRWLLPFLLQQVSLRNSQLQLDLLWDHRIDNQQFTNAYSRSAQFYSHPNTIRDFKFVAIEQHASLVSLARNHATEPREFNVPVQVGSRTAATSQLRFHTNTVRKWKLSDLSLVEEIPTKCPIESWSLDATAEKISADQPQLPADTNIQLVPITNASQLKNQLVRLSNLADLVILIAPEPTLSQYAQWLSETPGSANPKLLNLTVDTLQFAEDKRNYTTLPWVTLSDFLSAASDDTFDSNNRQKLLNNQLLIKPINSCGSENTFRVCVRSDQPFGRLIARQNALDHVWGNWISPANSTAQRDSYMVMPWSNGTSASISFFSTNEHLYQFPMCEHIVHQRSIEQNDRYEISRVRYNGSRWLRAPGLKGHQSKEQQAYRPTNGTSLIKKLLRHEQIRNLRGWFGIDLMIEQDTCQVIDFNGRWTSSYNLLRHLRMD